MCRSLAQGGRRCTGARPLTPGPASPVPYTPVASSGAGDDASTTPPTTQTVPGADPTAAETKREARREARRAARQAARDRFALADRELRDAERAVNGSVLGTLSGVLLGPLSRQASRAENGGDPDTYRERVDEGRSLARGVLIERGDTPAEADAKLARLEAAHKAWRATPEPK